MRASSELPHLDVRAELEAAHKASKIQPLRPQVQEQRPPTRKRSKVATVLNFQDLIHQLPDGWAPRKEGPPSASKLSVGEIAGMLPAHLLRFNEMTGMAEVQTTKKWELILETDIDSAYVILSQKGWVIVLEPISKAVLHVARQQRFHPVRQYLEGLVADGSIVPFDLDQVAPQFLRAASPLHVAMVRAWLIGAVKRALEPGCKMDYVLVLHGLQGILKSGFFEALSSLPFFNCSAPAHELRFLLNVHSCWIFELAELDSITSRQHDGHLKNLITTPVDLVTVPYGKKPEPKARQSVFCGTCNKNEFLRDDTGSRRFWVVPIKGTQPIDIEAVSAARDRIWKAAVLACQAGELPKLPSHMERQAEEQNEQFNVEDTWLPMLRRWIAGRPMVPDGTPWLDPSQPFTSAEVLQSAGLRRLDYSVRADETRLAPVLRQLGFEKKQVTRGTERPYLWLRPADQGAAQPAQPAQPPPEGGCAPPRSLAGQWIAAHCSTCSTSS